MTIDELKSHLNIIGDEENLILSAKLAAAQALVNAHICELHLSETAVGEATLRLAASFYEQREAIHEGSLDSVPFGVWELIEPYRERSF